MSLVLVKPRSSFPNQLFAWCNLLACVLQFWRCKPHCFTNFARQWLRIIFCHLFLSRLLHARSRPRLFRWVPLANCLCPLSLFRRHCRMSDPLYLACRPVIYSALPSSPCSGPDLCIIKPRTCTKSSLLLDLVNYKYRRGKWPNFSPPIAI